MKKRIKGKSVRALAILLSTMMITGTACVPVLAAQASDGVMQEEFSMNEEGIGEFPIEDVPMENAPIEEPPKEELPQEEPPMKENAGSDFDAQGAGCGSAEQDAQDIQQDPQEDINEGGQDAQTAFDADTALPISMRKSTAS